MALYGFFISAPLSHILIGLLQRAFADRTSLMANLARFLTNSLLVISPQNWVHLYSLALIACRANAKVAYHKAASAFGSTSVVVFGFAQTSLPEYVWEHYFNLVGFVMGTYVNVRTRKNSL
ncbi:uncharacterized protein BO97DRAFT_455120, partial [Aspergillus homomorphus CBS 101889]